MMTKAMFIHLSREIENGACLWAIVTLNEYREFRDGPLGKILTTQATERLSTKQWQGDSAALIAAALAGTRLPNLPAGAQSLIRQLDHRLSYSDTELASAHAALPCCKPRFLKTLSVRQGWRGQRTQQRQRKGIAVASLVRQTKLFANL